MDDLAFVREHIPEYGDYSDEASRHETDEYLRAYVGERLSAVRDRFAGKLDERAAKTLDELILRCQFTDQVFIRWMDHARLEPAAVAHLVHIDRGMIELADRARAAAEPELGDLFDQLDIAFESRHEPLPA
jgi:hypothetical protein